MAVRWEEQVIFNQVLIVSLQDVTVGTRLTRFVKILELPKTIKSHRLKTLRHPQNLIVLFMEPMAGDYWIIKSREGRFFKHIHQSLSSYYKERPNTKAD